MNKLNFKRVDVQVSIFTACVVILASACIFLFGYSITYNTTLVTLTNRVYSIYNFINQELDSSTFQSINTRDDMTSESYLEQKKIFHSIKSATGVRYLYTAKRNEAGELIYVIDGLDDTAEDFRYPGDLIETEIIPELTRALSGEKILPNDILHTTWGDIFIAYMPITTDNGATIGAIGIEFPAEVQYKTYHNLRVFTPIVIIICCLLSSFFALVYFKRISNPNYKDLANSDYLTGLKNRNAYEVDTKNMCALEAAANVGLILADLNGLKKVNDTLGHEIGDLYIKLLGQALEAVSFNSQIIYRLGGDEFAVIMRNATVEELDEFIRLANDQFALLTKGVIAKASCSFGYAICKSNNIADFEQAYRDADAAMYACKKNHYDTNNGK